MEDITPQEEDGGINYHSCDEQSNFEVSGDVTLVPEEEIPAAGSDEGNVYAASKEKAMIQELHYNSSPPVSRKRHRDTLDLDEEEFALGRHEFKLRNVAQDLELEYVIPGQDHARRLYDAPNPAPRKWIAPASGETASRVVGKIIRRISSQRDSQQVDEASEVEIEKRESKIASRSKAGKSRPLNPFSDSERSTGETEMAQAKSSQDASLLNFPRRNIGFLEKLKSSQVSRDENGFQTASRAAAKVPKAAETARKSLSVRVSELFDDDWTVLGRESFSTSLGNGSLGIGIEVPVGVRPSSGQPMGEVVTVSDYERAWLDSASKFVESTEEQLKIRPQEQTVAGSRAAGSRVSSARISKNVHDEREKNHLTARERDRNATEKSETYGRPNKKITENLRRLYKAIDESTCSSMDEGSAFEWEEDESEVNDEPEEPHTRKWEDTLPPHRGEALRILNRISAVLIKHLMTPDQVAENIISEHRAQVAAIIDDFQKRQAEEYQEFEKSLETAKNKAQVAFDNAVAKFQGIMQDEEEGSDVVQEALGINRKIADKLEAVLNAR